MRRIMQVCVAVLILISMASKIRAQEKTTADSLSIIKFEFFDMKVLKELPETFFIKTPGILRPWPPPVDAEKLYKSLYSLKQQGIVDVTRVEVFAEDEKKGVLDTRKDIPGTDEKEGLYLEVTPKIMQDDRIGVTISMRQSILVELKRVSTTDDANKVIPIISSKESSDIRIFTSDRPETIGGMLGKKMDGGTINFNTEEIYMIKVTRYFKPKAGIEFRPVKSSPETGFTQTSIPDSVEKIYVADKSEIDNSDIIGVKSGLSHQGFEEIEIVFTEEGKKKFAALTGKLIGERLAILVDGQVVSAPVVREKITGGMGHITGNKEISEKILGK